MFVSPHLRVEGTPARGRPPGVPQPRPGQDGVPQPGGTHLGYPQPGQDGGTQLGGTFSGCPNPNQVRMGSTPARGYLPGVPPARSEQEVPQTGGTHLGYPLARSGHPARGTPFQGTPTPARSEWRVPQPGGTCLGYPWPGQDKRYPSQGAPTWGTPWPGLDGGIFS